MTSAAALGSTYRLQLNGLGFTGARALVPYLHRLGIETLYLSPILAAAPGSTHGYDVIDPDRLDPALGSAEEFESLLEELAAHGMRALLDIVPNHMAAERAEPVVVGHVAPGPGLGLRRHLRHRLEPARRARAAPGPGRTPCPDGRLGLRARRSRRCGSRDGRPGLPSSLRRRPRRFDHGAVGRAALPAGVLAARRHRGQLQAVLQHRRARRCAGGGSGRVHPDPRAHPAALRRRKDRRAPRRPHRRPVGPGAVPDPPGRRARRSRSEPCGPGGEDPQPRRGDRRTLARRRDDRLRIRRPGGRALPRRVRLPAAVRHRIDAHGRTRHVRGVGGGRQAGDARPDLRVPARSVGPADPGGARRGPRRARPVAERRPPSLGGADHRTRRLPDVSRWCAALARRRRHTRTGCRPDPGRRGSGGGSGGRTGRTRPGGGSPARGALGSTSAAAGSS